MPPELLGSLKLLPYVLVSGPHRTFLKESVILDYIPGGRGDRTKEAPSTIFVRALQIKKNQLNKEDCTVLDQGKIYRSVMTIHVVGQYFWRLDGMLYAFL